MSYTVNPSLWFFVKTIVSHLGTTQAYLWKLTFSKLMYIKYKIETRLTFGLCVWITFLNLSVQSNRQTAKFGKDHKGSEY
jgi:hypothetical protein